MLKARALLRARRWEDQAMVTPGAITTGKELAPHSHDDIRAGQGTVSYRRQQSSLLFHTNYARYHATHEQICDI